MPNERMSLALEEQRTEAEQPVAVHELDTAAVIERASHIGQVAAETTAALGRELTWRRFFGKHASEQAKPKRPLPGALGEAEPFRRLHESRFAKDYIDPEEREVTD